MGRRGPPRMPTQLAILHGNTCHRPLDKDPEPDIPPEVPAAPEFLSGYARQEWHRVAAQLHRLKLLTVVDIQPLAAYCEAYARWRNAVEMTAQMAKDDYWTRGLIKTSTDDGVPIPNPLVKIAREAAQDMIRYAGEFGLTPSARARIAAGPADSKPSKFAGLLAS